MPTAVSTRLSTVFIRVFPLFFACLLLTCPQARATSIENLPGSKIIISGNGFTVFYGSGLSYTARKNGSTSPVSGEVAASSQDGSVILAHNGVSWAIFTGSAASGYTQQATFTHSIAGMSPDGTALVGSAGSMSSSAVLRTSSDNVHWTSTSLSGISAFCYGSDVSNINVDGKWVVVGYDDFSQTGLVWFVDASDTSSWTGRSLSGTSVYANFVSADGTLAAGYSTDDSTGKARASIWNTGTGAVTLLDHDASISSGILGINTTGSVLVGYGNSNGNDQALYWTGSGTSYTLHNLKETLEEAGVSTSSWTLSKATGVSDDGNIIVGTGTLSNDNVVYLANLGAGGLTTTEALYQSLGTMGQVGPAVAGMGQLSMGRLGSVSGGQGMHFAVNTPGGSPARWARNPACPRVTRCRAA